MDSNRTAVCYICGSDCVDQSEDGITTSFCGDGHGVCCKAWWWNHDPYKMLSLGGAPENVVLDEPNVGKLDRASREAFGLGQSLRLHGNVGTGKTFSALAHVSNYLKGFLHIKDIGRIYGNPHGVFQFIWSRQFHDKCTDLMMSRDKLDKGGQTERDLMQKVMGCSALIIDDLFAEKETDASVARMLTIINHRYSARLMTIITTNLTIQEMDEVNPRITSRVFDWSSIDLGGEDRRLSQNVALDEIDHIEEQA